MHAFVDKNVAVALDRQRKLVRTGKPTDNGGRVRYTLLQQMAMENQDPYDLRSEILNVFFPARDTAATAFGNIMFYLARHPQVWGRTSQRGLESWLPRSHLRATEIAQDHQSYNK